MAEESLAVAAQVCWFSTLVSKGANVAPLEARLKRLGARQLRVVEMAQGQKRSRFVAWTFLDDSEQQAWRARHWQPVKG
jgi:23S rRNA (adenine1618-N6)-methyltransferase